MIKNRSKLIKPIELALTLPKANTQISVAGLVTLVLRLLSVQSTSDQQVHRGQCLQVKVMILSAVYLHALLMWTYEAILQINSQAD